MYYGTSFVRVRNRRDEAPNKLWGELGWKASEEKPGKIAEKSRIDPTDPDKSKREFLDQLKKSLDQAGGTQLCLFAHGAADGFEDCSQDAAQLEYAMKKPLVLYSWPSDPRRRGYEIDGVNCEWSQAHFDMFLKDLLALRSEHPLQVIAIAHSMGNRLVVRSLPAIYGTGLIKDCELVSPDIDAATCRHYVMGFPEIHGTLRLYVSNRDKLLPLSQLLAGGYYRMGEAANPIQHLQPVQGRFMQRIDFTALDKGLTGHSIPFELIDDMVETGKPGEGLALVEEESVTPSRFEKFAGRSQGLKSATEEPGGCVRVVRTAPAR
jgi:esterase/lipase superfamily enzyme